MDDTIVEARNQVISENELAVYVRSFCGEEFSSQEIGASFTSYIIDWNAHCSFSEVCHRLCKKCYDKFLANQSRYEQREIVKGGDL